MNGVTMKGAAPKEWSSSEGRCTEWMDFFVSISNGRVMNIVLVQRDSLLNGVPMKDLRIKAKGLEK